MPVRFRPAALYESLKFPFGDLRLFLFIKQKYILKNEKNHLLSKKFLLYILSKCGKMFSLRENDSKNCMESLRKMNILYKFPVFDQND